MTRRDVAHSVIGFASVAGIGVGGWWINPAFGLIGVSSLLLSGVIYARTRR